MVIYPGSFDPVTYGHIDIATRAARIFNELLVAVLDNPNKKPFFSISKRIEFLKAAFNNHENIHIDSFSGSLADYVKQKNADIIIRGLRTPSDFESEAPYATANRIFTLGAETIFLPADPKYSHISSSIAREALTLGLDTKSLIPQYVKEEHNGSIT